MSAERSLKTVLLVVSRGKVPTPLPLCCSGGQGLFSMCMAVLDTGLGRYYSLLKLAIKVEH